MGILKLHRADPELRIEKTRDGDRIVSVMIDADGSARLRRLATIAGGGSGRHVTEMRRLDAM